MTRKINSIRHTIIKSTFSTPSSRDKIEKQKECEKIIIMQMLSYLIKINIKEIKTQEINCNAMLMQSKLAFEIYPRKLKNKKVFQ